MTARRSRYAPRLIALVLSLAAFGVQPAYAGMFDDDEARRQIKDLSIQTNERLETLSKAQFDLVNQLQSLREENAKLRGQVEALTYELESAKKRQQDFYVDLDGRLRKIESPNGGSETPDGKAADDSKGVAEPGKKAVVADPAAESRDYEAALNFFKATRSRKRQAPSRLLARTTRRVPWRRTPSIGSATRITRCVIAGRRLMRTRWWWPSGHSIRRRRIP